MYVLVVQSELFSNIILALHEDIASVYFSVELEWEMIPTSVL